MTTLPRWRLVLGDAAGETLPSPTGTDLGRDKALSALYDRDDNARAGSLGASAPSVARWLGDIRSYFPTSVVSFLQREALEKVGLKKLLMEPELLSTLEPNLELATTLLGLAKVIPKKTRETARAIVRQVTDQLDRRLRERLVQAVRGALRSGRTSRPRQRELDWDRTIRANLSRAVLLPGRLTATPIPERRIGWRRRQAALKDVILCIDQSGSMAASLVHASIMGSVMASIRSLRTRLIVFDTEVVDLSEHLRDPVDLLFGAQLGGGTDIGRALDYVTTLVARPADTIVVLVSDLFEGGDPALFLARARDLALLGTRLVVLLALSDEGKPNYDHEHAAALARLGVPTFTCTPDLFPELMAQALRGQDLDRWASAAGLHPERPAEPSSDF
jgi:Mg-chelatase subunit ChlD